MALQTPLRRWKCLNTADEASRPTPARPHHTRILQCDTGQIRPDLAWNTAVTAGIAIGPPGSSRDTASTAPSSRQCASGNSYYRPCEFYPCCNGRARSFVALQAPQQLLPATKQHLRVHTGVGPRLGGPFLYASHAPQIGPSHAPRTSRSPAYTHANAHATCTPTEAVTLACLEGMHPLMRMARLSDSGCCTAARCLRAPLL